MKVITVIRGHPQFTKAGTVSCVIRRHNKFFEFVPACFIIVVAPSLGMIFLLREHDLDILPEDFAAVSMAATVLSIADEKVWQNADLAVKQLFYDMQAPLFLKFVQQLLCGVK